MREVFERMPMARLREVAKESHAEHDPEATRVFVNRVLDMEVERRTWYAHRTRAINRSAQPPGLVSLLAVAL